MLFSFFNCIFIVLGTFYWIYTFYNKNTILTQFYIIEIFTVSIIRRALKTLARKIFHFGRLLAEFYDVSSVRSLRQYGSYLIPQIFPMAVIVKPELLHFLESFEQGKWVRTLIRTWRNRWGSHYLFFFSKVNICSERTFYP